MSAIIKLHLKDAESNIIYPAIVKLGLIGPNISYELLLRELILGIAVDNSEYPILEIRYKGSCMKDCIEETLVFRRYLYKVIGINKYITLNSKFIVSNFSIDVLQISD